MGETVKVCKFLSKNRVSLLFNAVLECGLQIVKTSPRCVRVGGSAGYKG
jgi:hypothetical protein